MRVMNTAKAQAEPWRGALIADIPVEKARELWEESCHIKHVRSLREQEAALEAEFQFACTRDLTFPRVRILRKLNKVRQELMRIGGVEMPWERRAV